MASLIYVTNTNNSLFVRRITLQFVSLLPPEAAILTAVIRQHGEPTPELEQQTHLAWHGPLRVGDLDVIVAVDSEVKLHDPVGSDSEDSDALYFGESDKFGILLQYLSPKAWRTKDVVAHTSVHHHEKGRETYYLLGGTASVELRDFRTGTRMGNASPLELGVGQEAGYIKGFSVQPYVQHPVVARNGTGSIGSIMLLVTNPPNNTKSDHHYDGKFRDIFADVIASHTQRTHGPSGGA
ncbi:hypothetical protein HYY73_01610 [Candidatus Woesearchaeota archaeon]|nr:hypothetical protein [Candidatus Woesearchaeota archaeon]